tara:strand:+ start:173 stop:1276 length:1104 start_codon:yes stop_codon:yes gene_type:complete
MVFTALTLNLNEIIIVKRSSAKNKVSQTIVQQIIVGELIFCIIAMSISVVHCVLISPTINQFILTSVWICILAARKLASLVRPFFIAEKREDIIFFIFACPKAIFATAILVSLYFGFGLSSVFIIFFLEAILTVILAAKYFKKIELVDQFKYHYEELAITVKVAFNSLRSIAIPMNIMRGSNVLRANSDKVLLTFIGTNEIIGVYTFAKSVNLIIMSIGRPFQTTLLRHLRQYSGSRRKTLYLYGFMTICGFCLAASINIFNNHYLEWLLGKFKEELTNSFEYIVILNMSLISFFSFIWLRPFFITQELLKKWCVVTLITTAWLPVAQFYLISNGDYLSMAYLIVASHALTSLFGVIYFAGTIWRTK